MTADRARELAMIACRDLRDAGVPSFVVYAGTDELWHMASLQMPASLIADALRKMAKAVEEQMPDSTIN